MTSLQQLVNRFPPVLVRMMAKNPDGERVTVEQISQRAGISHRTVLRLSRKLTWDDVPVAVASSFIMACNVDVINWKQAAMEVRNAMKNPRSAFQHLPERTRNHLAGLL